MGWLQTQPTEKQGDDSTPSAGIRLLVQPDRALSMCVAVCLRMSK